MAHTGDWKRPPARRYSWREKDTVGRGAYSTGAAPYISFRHRRYLRNANSSGIRAVPTGD